MQQCEQNMTLHKHVTSMYQKIGEESICDNPPQSDVQITAITGTLSRIPRLL